MPPGPYPVRRPLRHEPPNWVKQDAVYFVTICAKTRGKNQLCTDETGLPLLETLRQAEQLRYWWIFTAVLMPDHLHMLVSFPPEPGMKEVVRSWKRFAARRFGIVWQDGFFDHRLRCEESVEEKGSYIEANPVRAGLVKEISDWPFRWLREA